MKTKNGFSDDDLDALKQHDSKAVLALVERMESKIYRYAFGMLNDHGLAQDVVQETFLGVFKGLNEFKKKSSFDTWIWSIAHGCIAKVFRRYKRKESYHVSMSELSPEFDFETTGPPLENLIDQYMLVLHVEAILQDIV